MQFHSHAGKVTVIDVNPFHPNIFFSAGADGAVKLYDASIRCTVLEFYLPCSKATDICSIPVIDAKFSPTRETVIVFASRGGLIVVWDISESIDFPTEQFTIPLKKREKNSDASIEISSLSFYNAGIGGLLSVADSSGAVHLLRLPEALWRSCTNTENLLRILGLK